MCQDQLRVIVTTYRRQIRASAASASILSTFSLPSYPFVSLIRNSKKHTVLPDSLSLESTQISRVDSPKVADDPR